ncbi:HtaA domain-containing protein [Streptomyces sp. SCA3-4]|uniref:HtaA domain-containing protein n=1 Tax=Streptomyces sichuanensis TaxID=2871810 RepID=UPI001CE347B4|nr:HtaA domain-containing protein [Streptomyces sichuanensis]MCA6096198.1 HtaA domain-containing protein [Streptomyces sichuanensis]
MTVAARRRPLALAAAVATAAAALGATALTVPAAHAADGPPPQMQLKDGTLDWGLKKSFREYIETGFGGGTIEVADGARRTGDGPFTFTGGTGTYDMASHAVATTFKGGVRFLGHDGELDLTFADLKLAGDAGGKTGRITADVTRDGATQDDVPLASLDLGAAKRGGGKGGVITLGEIPAKLTAQGAKVFAYRGRSFYKEGAALDNASLTVTAVAQPPAGGGTKETGTSTDHPGTKDAGTSTDHPATRDAGTSTDDPGTKSGAGTPTTEGGRTGDGKPAQGGVHDGRLDWGIKKSFREYITDGYAKGKAELLGDAVKKGDSYRFPKGHGTYDASANTLDAAFNGEVRFSGHDGELDLKLGNFTVKASTTGATLSADVSAKGKESTTTTKAVPLAHLKPGADAFKAKDGVVSLSAVPATLTEEGAKVFSYKGRSFYKAGTDLDPVNLAVAVEKDAKLPDDQGSSSGTGTGTGSGSGSAAGSGSTGTGSGSGTGGGATGSEASLAATGAGVPAGPLAGGAAALVVAGGAAVYATRRRASLAKG